MNILQVKPHCRICPSLKLQTSQDQNLVLLPSVVLKSLSWWTLADFCLGFQCLNVGETHRLSSRFCMVYSEVPNFSEPNPELLNQPNQQNKSVSRVEAFDLKPVSESPGRTGDPLKQ